MIPQERTGLAWKERRGSVWAELQPLLDRLFSPFEEMMMNASITSGVCDVLDVGCGTGATTMAFAARLAPHGRCTGIDISGPMLDVARSRATATGLDNARFIKGDAQCFEMPHQAFDAAISRFGVMFFGDPVRAFANIRHAVRSNGTLTCVVWRSEAENPFMIAAERAAAPILGWANHAAPDAPGQFAFADAARVERILRTAGWCTVAIRPVDVPCSLSKADLAIYARSMGRVGMILPDLDQTLREQVEKVLDDAFAHIVVDDVARFDSACWLVHAVAP